MSHPSVHNRQFMLGPTQKLARPDWQSLCLERGLYLSHCPKLSVTRIADRRNRQWLLLGVAVQVDPGKPSPAEALRRYSGEDIASIYHTWSGRWLLIGDGAVHLDAGGFLGCFYRVASDETGRSQLWMSSSLALLADVSELAAPGGAPRQLVYADGFAYDPPPRTCYSGIRKLLPTQVLDIASGLPRLRPLVFLDAPYEQVLDELADCLVAAMANLRDGGAHGLERPSSIWLASSAGYDSRLLFAAAKAANLAFSTYTQVYPGMSTSDRVVPQQLARLADVEHWLIYPKSVNRGLLGAFDEHCCSQNVDSDRRFYACGQWEWAQAGDVLVRGLSFPMGHASYRRKLPSEPPTVDGLLRVFGAERSPYYVRDSMSQYLAWLAQTPMPGLDWRDRFQLDVRLGGWASTVEHALDMVKGVSYCPANSARIHSLLLAVPEEKRITRQHHKDLIVRLAPNLLNYPFNERDHLTRRVTRQLGKCGALLRARGLVTTLRQIRKGVGRRLKRNVAFGGIGSRQL